MTKDKPRKLTLEEKQDKLLADGRIEPIKPGPGQPLGMFRTVHTAKPRMGKGKLRGRLPGRAQAILALGANKGYRKWA